MALPNPNTYLKSSRLRSIHLPPSHQMPIPSPESSPWSSSNLSWSTNNENSRSVVEFSGSSNNKEGLQVPRTPPHFKRKAEMISPIPSKHIITEAKMVAHLDGLHISSNFTSHSNDTSLADSLMEETSNWNVAMSQEDLERRLKTAQRITICEQVRKLDTSNDIIPKILLYRNERPCTAMVLWQPPQKIQNFIVPNNESDDDSDSNGQDNNNSSSVDLNNFMDLDL